MNKAKNRFTVANEELNLIIQSSKSKVEVLRKLGVANPFGGGWYRDINRYIINNNIDISHFTGSVHNKGKTGYLNPFIPNDRIFVINSNYEKIANRVRKHKLLEYKCSECFLTTWQNKSIVLHLDHINGNSTDNRLENLRWLCPNCHSQTDTYCRGHKRKKEIKSGAGDSNPKLSDSKSESSANWDTPSQKINICNYCHTYTNNDKYCSPKCYQKHRKGLPSFKTRKVERPLKEVLEQEIKEHSFLYLGKKYGVSDKAVRKWCKYYGIEAKTRRPRGVAE